MDKHQKRLEELERRLAEQAARKSAVRPDLFAESFAEQKTCALDQSRLKVEFCTRRAAKTFSWGLEAIHDSYDWPKANYLFLGLTRPEAKRIFWKDVLKEIDARHGLNIRFNEAELTATMPNGATIYIGAADANEDEMRKLLGQKYRKVKVDEAQDWKRDLEQLVFHVLRPACADLSGSITLSGTPGIVAKGFFRDLTPSSVQAGIRGERSTGSQGWSVHCWDTHSNTSIAAGRRICDRWAEDIAQLKQMKPGVEATPWFRRNFLGEWVVEETLLVYRYMAGRNDFDKLPSLASRWRYVLGCDLGHSDPTAWVVAAYNEGLRTLFILEVLKKEECDITDVARITNELRRRYDFDVLVVDGANKQAVQEMVNRHGIPWTAAEKTGKADFIDLMNGDFITGNIKLGPGAKPLTEEYAGLVWDKKKMDGTGAREEHPACDNHATDAALYAWRYCYQYLSEVEPTRPEAGTKEHSEYIERELRAAAEKRHRPSSSSFDMSGFPGFDMGDPGGWGGGFPGQ